MIYDKLENINKYGFNLSFVNNYIANKKFQKGKIEINDSDQFAIGLEYETKDSKLGLWEGHRKYVDIHVILEGEEIVEISDISKMKSTKTYEEDYELFEGKFEQKILLTPGYFLLLFPHEIHKTGGIVGNKSSRVLKNVFKNIL